MFAIATDQSVDVVDAVSAPPLAIFKELLEIGIGSDRVPALMMVGPV